MTFFTTSFETGGAPVAEPSNLTFIIKPFLSETEVEQVKALEEKCVNFDHASLKLELDYKLSAAKSLEFQSEEMNEFLCYDKSRLVGYVGVMSFGGSEPEVCGMVDPQYRRQGIFDGLMELVKMERSRRQSPSMLILTDRTSNAGQAFVKTLGPILEHTEYEMFLKLPWEIKLTEDMKKGIRLRKASNQDADEVTRQNALYFKQESGTSDEQAGSDPDLTEASEVASERRIMPEEEEARGMTIYLAEIGDGVTIGKIHLDFRIGQGGIFGLGILPEYRNKGYGRALLLLGIEVLLEEGAEEVYLQVNAVNENALKLYLSCGFEVTSTMDYYRFQL